MTEMYKIMITFVQMNVMHLLQCVMVQRVAVRSWSSSHAARARSCPSLTSSRMGSGTTCEGPTRRSTGVRWRDATLSTRWSFSWLPSPPVLRSGHYHTLSFAVSDRIQHIENKLGPLLLKSCIDVSIIAWTFDLPVSM